MKGFVKRAYGAKIIGLVLALALVLSPARAALAAADIMYDGAVTLSADKTFTVTAYNSGASYTVNEATPLGALQAAGAAAGFSYDVTDKNAEASGALLLDNIGKHVYVKGGARWYAYVNDAYKDGFNNAPAALNLMPLANGDRVEFYFAAGVSDSDDVAVVKAAAVAAVKTVVSADGAAPAPTTPTTPPPTAVESSDWVLELRGDIGDFVNQDEFESDFVTPYAAEWTDKDGNVWSGTPLWALLAAVDDIESSNRRTFNEELAKAGYTIEIAAQDGFTRTYSSKDIVGSDDYIVANKVNGKPLTDGAPLRLVGAALTKDDGSLGGSAIGQIASITIPELLTPDAKAGSWNLSLVGKITDVFSQAEFEESVDCPRSGHLAEWTDKDGNVWSGMPLWLLTGWVDDRSPHSFNFPQAEAGYTVLVKAADGYTREFSSQDVANSKDYIVANKVNGKPLTEGAPLRLVGEGVSKEDGSLGGAAVGNIALIELADFLKARPVPQLRIVKFDADQITVIEEKTIDHKWMESNLPVFGDGETIYRYEGVTFTPDDIWGVNAEYPGGFKIVNAIKGTRIKDLAELVGGMGSGTEIVLVAKDGYETRFPYSSIYTDPAVQALQGDAVLAWWADGDYVPDYADGMRLFFAPEDLVYSQWDMHESLPEKYWHYYYGDGVQYPSCAGLSAKYISEIRIYSVPSGDWSLVLNGLNLGGTEYEVNKTYFEQALACQFGANHKVSYTDSKDRVWEGIPLWLAAGYVDDADEHSSDAFNADLALEGYYLIITGADGRVARVSSKDIIRNQDYIIANTLNGAPIPESDNSWPLRLVGPAVSGSDSISGVVSIMLDRIGFTDVHGHWAHANIADMVGRNVVNGYPDGSFKPNATISRAEFSTILVKALDLAIETDTAFSDTADHWAKDYISTAANAQITTGYADGSFGPDELLTREQMGTMIVRALGLEPETGELAFSDGTSIADWALDAIVTAVQKGILSGYPDNSFVPQGSATRAEALTAVVNALTK